MLRQNLACQDRPRGYISGTIRAVLFIIQSKLMSGSSVNAMKKLMVVLAIPMVLMTHNGFAAEGKSEKLIYEAGGITRDDVDQSLRENPLTLYDAFVLAVKKN